MTRLARMLLALCLALAAPQLLAETAIDNTRLQAARRFVVALGIGELFVDGVKLGFANEVKKNPERANEMRWVLEKITIAGAIERMTPIYAEYLTASQTDELRNFYASGPGRKVWQALSTAALAKQPPVAPALSAEETRRVMAFNANSVALRTLRLAQPAIDAKTASITKAWLQEIVMGNIAKTSRQIADALDPDSASAANTDSTAPAGPIAKFVPVMRTYNERNQKSLAQFQSNIDAIDLSTVLKPSKLTSRQGIAEGRTKLDRYEAAFSLRWREYNANTDDLMREVKNIANTSVTHDGLMAGAERGLTSAYERALRLQENQQNLVAIFREMLNLADEKFGGIRIEENRLIFDNGADLQAYETLRERLKKEVAVETKINEEEQQARESSLRLLRGEGTKQ